MKRRSFQLRIALLASVLAGGALVSFALLSGWLIREAKIDRLDARLDNALMRSLRQRDWSDLEASLERELGPRGDDTVALLIENRSGEAVYQSPDWPAGLTGGPAFDHRPNRRFSRRLADFPRNRDEPAGRDSEGRPPSLRWRTQPTDTGRWRVGILSAPLGQITIAASLQSVQQEMTAIRRIYWVTIPTMLLLIAGAAWIVAGRTLAPVRRLSQTIARVTVQGLHQRVPSRDADAEFVELIEVFNQMLERLERSFHQASRFSGDAAHELKTPLAILQGELEQAIQQAAAGSAIQQTLSNLLSEVTHLSGIVRKLLLLSLADAGQIALQRSALNLSDLLREQLEDIPWLNPNLTVQAEVADDLWIKGDRDLLTQVLQNLISNAVKYNLPAGWIRVRARRSTDRVQITLANAAKPLPPEDQDHLFERFYRSSLERDRQTEGLGLGLSLSREIVRAHGGELRLAATTAASVSFELALPGE